MYKFKKKGGGEYLEKNFFLFVLCCVYFKAVSIRFLQEKKKRENSKPSVITFLLFFLYQTTSFSFFSSFLYSQVQISGKGLVCLYTLLNPTFYKSEKKKEKREKKESVNLIGCTFQNKWPDWL